MKILVTGGAGYIGSVLSPLLLDAGHRVRVLDVLLHGGLPLLGVWANPDFEFRRGDVRDHDSVHEAVRGMDAVVHLAAIVGDPACARTPDVARAVNRDASLAVMDACRKAGVKRFVFASTCSNYGKMADPSQLADECSELRPVSLYAETKVAVEQAALGAPADDPLSATMLRFATVFGVSPRMRFDLTVNEFTVDMLRKEKLVVFGEQFWRPYVHVYDAARAVRMVLEAPEAQVRRQVFNVGSTSQNYQKQQLVDLIRPFAPNAVVEYVHKQEDPRDYRVSFAKIHDTLHYDTTHSVSDGIREVAELVGAGVVEDFDAPRYRN
jgi:nucleoside-diphosphate-sugar epimerase